MREKEGTPYLTRTKPNLIWQVALNEQLQIRYKYSVESGWFGETNQEVPSNMSAL